MGRPRRRDDPAILGPRPARVGARRHRLPPVPAGDPAAGPPAAGRVRRRHLRPGPARHAAGLSTEDLLRARAGEAPGAPDGVVRPASHDEVLEVLRLATDHRITVVPYGGGTSVVG